jgi:predicted transcriptional regulator YdeE
MPKTRIEKSITINASVDKVKSVIADFNHWRYWSPWLITDPEATVKVENGGKKQRWEGKRVGVGEMTVLKETDSVIHYNLTFLKPWKSTATVDFLIKTDSKEVTTLTWTMDGSLPFFMFWMKPMMERMLGMDYDRGLLMLKDYIEKGKIDAKLEFLGESDFAGCKYVGIKNECTIETVGKIMEGDIKKLNAYAKDKSDILSGDFFSVYHKVDLGKNRIIYTIGIGVKEAQDNLPSGMFKDSLPSTKVYTVRHTGPYELTGNAWSAIMGMEQAKEFKKNKKIPFMEFYRNNPMETDPRDLITDVCMPIK